MEKQNGPEILQGYESEFWLRSDINDCENWNSVDIAEAVVDYGDEEYDYKPVKVFMRPMTQEENDDIGEEDWWTADDGSDPEAVEYWEFEPIKETVVE